MKVYKMPSLKPSPFDAETDRLTNPDVFLALTDKQAKGFPQRGVFGDCIETEYEAKAVTGNGEILMAGTLEGRLLLLDHLRKLGFISAKYAKVAEAYLKR